jgi:di/tricarboxylate transporter
MTFQQVLVFGALAAALAGFAWCRLRFDLVAVLALVVSDALRLVPAEQALSGFGHPALTTVAAVLILTQALRNAGLVDLAVCLLRPLAGSAVRQTLALTAVTAFCSAFMNNAGAIALLMPVALKSAYDAGRPPSQLLMPLSCGALLGGLTTLIGTPPNIIIANFRGAETGTPFGMFDFTPVGFGVPLAGVAFIGIAGWRLLPKRRAAQDEIEVRFRIGDYITEACLPEDSPYVGRRLIDLEALGQGDLAVVALKRRQDRLLAPAAFLRLQAGDVLTIEADTPALNRVVAEAALDNLGTADLGAETLRSDRVGLAETVITPGSRLVGGTARGLRLHTRFGVNLLGVSRRGQPSGSARCA